MLFTDLVKKYGPWAFADLQARGSKNHVYYVDKDATNALDANDGVHGQTWENPFLTIGYAVTRTNADAATGSKATIYIRGSEYVESTTVTAAGTRFVGVGDSPVETTWTMVSLVNSATDGWCLKISAANCTVENIKFRPPAYVSSGVPAAINLSTGSSYAVIKNCRFQGRAGSYNAIYGLVPVGNVRIEGNEFIYMNTLSNGRGIYMPASAGVACSAWIIKDNYFNSCVEDINIDGRACILDGNTHPIVGLAADNSFPATVTTKAIDLSGSGTGSNLVTRCTLGGTYNLATYTPGASGDVWRGNFASIVETTAPNGLTVLVPAA